MSISVQRPGTYALVLRSEASGLAAIGALGELRVEPGFYVYVGSALGPGGLGARLRHHLREAPRPHWHIDYLRRFARVEEVWTCAHAGPQREHDWAAALRRCRQGAEPRSGFGASDCGCASHLFFFRCKPSLAGIRRRLPGPEPVRRWRR